MGGTEASGTGFGEGVGEHLAVSVGHVSVLGGWSGGGAGVERAVAFGGLDDAPDVERARVPVRVLWGVLVAEDAGQVTPLGGGETLLGGDRRQCVPGLGAEELPRGH